MGVQTRAAISTTLENGPERADNVDCCCARRLLPRQEAHEATDKMRKKDTLDEIKSWGRTEQSTGIPVLSCNVVLHNKEGPLELQQDFGVRNK